jgi:energy-converting hydrogenase A subunit M
MPAVDSSSQPLVPFMSKRILMSPRKMQNEIAMCLSAKTKLACNFDVLFERRHVLKCEDFHSKKSKGQQKEMSQKDAKCTYHVAWLGDVASTGRKERSLLGYGKALASVFPTPFVVQEIVSAGIVLDRHR